MKLMELMKRKRPTKCEECDIETTPFESGRSRLHAHHDDYAKPDDVRYLCPACHGAWHTANGKGANHHLSKHYTKPDRTYETVWMRPADVAQALCVSNATLCRWRTDGYGPPFVRMSNRVVRYRVDEVSEWEDRLRDAE